MFITYHAVVESFITSNLIRLSPVSTTMALYRPFWPTRHPFYLVLVWRMISLWFSFLANNVIIMFHSGMKMCLILSVCWLYGRDSHANDKFSTGKLLLRLSDDICPPFSGYHGCNCSSTPWVTCHKWREICLKCICILTLHNSERIDSVREFVLKS